MISLNALLIFLIVLYSASLGLNSEEGDETSNDVSSTNAPLCRLVRNMKRSLHDEFKSRFKDELVCNIDGGSNCTSVTCSSAFNESISGGLRLHICDAIPNVEFWMTSNITNKSARWSQSFWVRNDSQKVEIHPMVNVSVSSSSKWYLKVNLNLDHSNTRAKIPSPYNYLSFNATIEVLAGSNAKPVQEILVNSTRFPLPQICGDAVYEAQPLREKQPLELQRSFMRAEELSSEDVHISSKRTSVSSQKCDQKSIFECGVGATCVMTATVGICECLKDYVLAPNGSCIPHRVSPPTPNPTVQPLPSSNNNSTYSSALGAILSILTLLAIAAAVFFGTKYRVFSRIRSQLPLTVPVWPFGRDTTVDDQVDMVDPFSQEEDDPPLL